MALVTEARRPYIQQPDGSISRRYANPDTYLIPPDEWPRWRPEVVRQTATPSRGLERLHAREAELETAMAQVEQLLARQDGHLRIEEDQLVLAPLEASLRPSSANAFADRIAERLPGWSSRSSSLRSTPGPHFSRHLALAAEMEGVQLTRLPHLYASLLAHACNVGLEQMAHLTDLAYEHLAWCPTCYLCEETLKAAFTALVNYHDHLPLSQLWGNGLLSSSDG